MFQMGQLAELQFLYPEYKGLLFEDLLKGISGDVLRKITTYLIGKNLYGEKEIELNDLINNWFSRGNSAFAEQFSERVKKYEKDNKKRISIVHTISCLKILQYGLELQEKGGLNTKSKEQSEIDILFALLICNQNEDYNQTKDKDKIKAMFPANYLEALLFNYSFPVNDITNFYFADYTYCQIIKSLMLFGFLDSNSEGQELLKRFCSYYRLSSWKGYFERVLPLISAWSNRDKPSSVDLVLEKNANYQNNYLFLERLAMNDYVKLEDVDYIKIREKPLLKLDDTTFRVIHPLFISDKIYKGLYFLFNQLNSELPKFIKNFRSWYTSNFTEGVCFQEIIKYSIANYDARFFDDELKVMQIIGPPDCYLREGNDVFLIENKDILINASIKGSYDFEATIKEIKKKLLIEEGRPVGIGQLIANIRKLLSKENTFDAGFSPDKTFIYPLLVVHDNMYDTMGLNKILNIFFTEEVSKLKHEGFDIDRIKALVLINIDTLIQVADILKNKKASLRELVESYIENSEGQKIKPFNEKDFTNALVPFSTFVANYMNERFGRNWKSEELMVYLFDKTTNILNDNSEQSKGQGTIY